MWIVSVGIPTVTESIIRISQIFWTGGCRPTRTRMKCRPIGDLDLLVRVFVDPQHFWPIELTSDTQHWPAQFFHQIILVMGVGHGKLSSVLTIQNHLDIYSTVSHTVPCGESSSKDFAFLQNIEKDPNSPQGSIWDANYYKVFETLPNVSQNSSTCWNAIFSVDL